MIKLLLLVAVLAVIPVWGIAGNQSTDELYDSDEYWEAPDPNRMCKPGQGITSAEECYPCPVGTYNFEGSRVDVCFKCPIGSFTNSTGQTECYECDEGSSATDPSSTAGDACYRPSLSNFAQATVGLSIEVGGIDFCTDIRELLYGISNVALYDAHITECTYDETSNKTKIEVQMTPPAKYAWFVWTGLNFVHVHLPVINAYASLGTFYAEKLFAVINNHSDMEIFGLNLDADMLDIEDILILKFEPSFAGHCPYIAAVGDMFCDAEPTSTTVTSPDARKFYLAVGLVGVDCSTNAEQILIRNWAEMSETRPYPCLADGSCEWKFVYCRPAAEGEGYTGVLVAATQYVTAGTTPEELFVQGTEFAVEIGGKQTGGGVGAVKENTCGPDSGVDVQVTETADGVNVDIELTVVCVPCGEGRFVNDVGMCEPCPFTTWGSDGVHCNSCGWDYETPFWGMTDEYQCIEFEDYDRDRDDKDRLRDPAGEIGFDLHLIPTLNMCGVADAKQSLDELCKGMFSPDNLSYSEDFDLEGWKIERMICFFSTNLISLYNDHCGDDWDKSWEQVFESLIGLGEEDEEGLFDLICYVAKRFNTLEETGTSDNCANVPEADYIMSMSTKFDGDFDIDSSGVLVPLLTRMANLETMNFASLASAGLAMMENVGIADLVSFTGWTLANDLRDLALSIPRGLSMTAFDFEAKYEQSRFFCDDRAVKRQCYDDHWCDVTNCQKSDKDADVELTCEKDECKNCAISFVSIATKKPFECRSCDFPPAIENGTLAHVLENKVEAMYVCDVGFVASRCSGHAQCDYNSESNNLELPTCVKDNCQYPEIENGVKLGDWRSEEDYYSCPYAKYRCIDGFMLSEHGGRATCHVYNDYQIEGIPTCMERCKFPAEIEHGEFVKEYRINDDYYAEYRCTEGFYLTEKPYWGSCDREWNMTVDKMVAVAILPTCGPPDTCEFPDWVNGAYKEHEWTEEDNYKKHAFYQCEEGLNQEGSGAARCNREDPSQFETTMLCYDGPKCHYDYDAVQGGFKSIADNGAVFYECHDGYEMEGDSRAKCQGGEPSYPECVALVDSCELPESIENGHRDEKYHNKAHYNCNNGDGWRLPDAIRNSAGWVMCDGDKHEPAEPVCEEYSCDFAKVIEHGTLQGQENTHAWYECLDDYRFLDDENEATCDVNGNIDQLPSCIPRGDPCDFTTVVIEHGYINGDDVQEFSAHVICNDGYRILDGKDRVYCNANGTISEVPVCKRWGCDFPEIEHGKIADRGDYGAKYGCNEDYKLDGDNDWLPCDPSTGFFDQTNIPNCVEDDGSDEGDGACRFPDYIPKGYKVWQGEDQLDDSPFELASYMCYPPFVNTPNKEMMKATIGSGSDLTKAYMDLYGVAVCHNGVIYLPECMDPEEAGHCGIPTKIHKGKAVELMWKEAGEDGDEKDDVMMPMMARYECNEGYVMHKTIKGDIGWCRMDGSMEIPICDERNDYINITFKLQNGRMTGLVKDGKVFGGVVLVQGVDLYGNPKSEWEYGCNDGFNNNAAGAICRSIGFGHGTQIPVSKKMVVDEHKFGWTKIDCKYDDTLITSDNCNGMRYEEAIEKIGVKATCFNFDVIAVKCFESVFKVDVTMNFSRKKITCNAQFFKEDTKLNLGNMELNVKFLLDGSEIETGDVRYRQKKGFVAKVDLRKKDFKCASCQVYADAASQSLLAEGEKCKD